MLGSVWWLRYQLCCDRSGPILKKNKLHHKEKMDVSYFSHLMPIFLYAAGFDGNFQVQSGGSEKIAIVVAGTKVRPRNAQSCLWHLICWQWGGKDLFFLAWEEGGCARFGKCVHDVHEDLSCWRQHAPLKLSDEFDGLDHGGLFSVSCLETLCFFFKKWCVDLQSSRMVFSRLFKMTIPY